ncbi:MAG: hypothetical protein RXR02_07905 [Thermoproteus sp.]
MRIPLPILAAALAIIAAGVAMLHISVPNRPASIFINASALQPGQNMTLHLNYVPFNITIIKPNTTWAVLCMYFHGMLVDSYNIVWLNIYSHPYPPPAAAVATTFIYADDMKDSDVTILLIVGQYNCPPQTSV